MRELVRALDADFAGQEVLRVTLSERVPKFGEGAGLAEALVQTVSTIYAGELGRHTNPRGGPYLPGFWTMTTHQGFGALTGALPSGRRAGEPLANGASPCTGCDRRGPTASLNAAAHLAPVANGSVVNLRLDPGCIAGEHGDVVLEGLLRGYFDQGGLQVQIDVLDVQTLIEARRHPERHRGLVVRISGYSAYFNDLTEPLKDELIARTVHGARAHPEPPSGL